MKKRIIGLGAVFITILLVSTVTAVPQTHSEPAMNMIETIEQQTSIQEQVDDTPSLEDIIGSKGIIDWIIQLLQTILDLILALINFVLDLFQIVNLINMIISAITQLVTLIGQFIQSILDLFNPPINTIL